MACLFTVQTGREIDFHFVSPSGFFLNTLQNVKPAIMSAVNKDLFLDHKRLGYEFVGSQQESTSGRDIVNLLFLIIIY